MNNLLHPNFNENGKEIHAERRRNAINRFALNFLAANLDSLESDGFFDGAFVPVPTVEEIEQIKRDLGIEFSYSNTL